MASEEEGTGPRRRGPWRRRLLLLAVVAALAAAGAWCRHDPATHVARKKYALRQLYRALAMYSDTHGQLPSSVEGMGAALGLAGREAYVLRGQGAAPDESARDAEHRALVDLVTAPHSRRWSRRARWREADHGIVGGDYEYLNKDRRLERSYAAFAVLAEERGVSRWGRWVAFSNGSLLWVSWRNPRYHRPLGVPWVDVISSEPLASDQPHGHMGGAMRRVHRARLRQLKMSLLNYALAQGAFPYSPEGGDSALYAARADAPDATVFDLVNPRLENGAAYWDVASGTLRNSDFEYLSRPIEINGVEDLREPALLVSKWGATGDSTRLVLTTAGHWFSVGPGHPHADDPLGIPLSEFGLRDTAAEVSGGARRHSPMGARSSIGPVARGGQIRRRALDP